MYCGKCGNKVKDSDQYCPKCGNKLHENTTPPSAPVVIDLWSLLTVPLLWMMNKLADLLKKNKHKEYYQDFSCLFGCGVFDCIACQCIWRV